MVDLRLHGVSAHLIWLFHVLYSNQKRQISGHSDVSRGFSGSPEQLGYMLDELMTSLGKVGLKLAAAKAKVLISYATTEDIDDRARLEIAVLDQSPSHKWLGCMLSTENASRR